MDVSIDVFVLGRRYGDDDAQAELDRYADHVITILGGTRGRDSFACHWRRSPNLVTVAGSRHPGVHHHGRNLDRHLLNKEQTNGNPDLQNRGRLVRPGSRRPRRHRRLCRHHRPVRRRLPLLHLRWCAERQPERRLRNGPGDVVRSRADGPDRGRDELLARHHLLPVARPRGRPQPVPVRARRRGGVLLHGHGRRQPAEGHRQGASGVGCDRWPRPHGADRHGVAARRRQAQRVLR